jgi:hypothetical protein
MIVEFWQIVSEAHQHLKQAVMQIVIIKKEISCQNSRCDSDLIELMIRRLIIIMSHIFSPQ